MKFKKILIFTLVISSLITLYSCSSSSTNETASTKDSITQNIDSTENEKSHKNSNSPKIDTNKTQENNSTKNRESEKKSSTRKETDTKNDNSKINNNLTYKSQLGFSINFPDNWKDRYTIKEDSNSISVYFKSSDLNTSKNSGLFFVIIKNINPSDENKYDSIDGEKHITVGNNTYFVGGPTDVNLNEKNKDFNIFLSMNKERKKVINTIKPL